MDLPPLSLKTRRTLSFVFIALFLIVFPTIVLYASGYRLDDTFSLTETGGIFVAVPESGVSVLLDGEEIERSTLFTRSFFIDDLTPGAYRVDAARDGEILWTKQLVVEPRVVTDVLAVIIEQPLVVRPVVATTTPSESSTSTVRGVTRQQLTALEEIFATTTPPLIPEQEGEEPPEDRDEGRVLSIEDGDVLVAWVRDTDRIPNAFCLQPSSCVAEFALEGTGETAVAAKFYDGGVVYATREGGVYFSEVDVRPPQFVVPVYPKARTTFRIVDGALYVKDGKTIYAVEGIR